MLSTGTGQPSEPRRRPKARHDPTVDKWFDPTAFQPWRRRRGPTATRAATRCAGPAQFNIDVSVIKYTSFDKFKLELRAEAFNLLNHPQFNNPNGTFGNAGVGQITAMLPNPACSLCGNTERNIQFAAKITF